MFCPPPPPSPDPGGGGGTLAFGGGGAWGEPIKTTDQGTLAFGILCGMNTFSLLTNYVACKAVAMLDGASKISIRLP
jgi:hypothetical protein